MPKAENSDAPDRLRLTQHLDVIADDQPDAPTDLLYLRSTPARAAADQMLKALKAMREVRRVANSDMPDDLDTFIRPGGGADALTGDISNAWAKLEAAIAAAQGEENAT